MTITIFTPTYNRCEKLTKLFNSLMIQTVKDFEWLIVDDGSTDNTYQKILSFKETATFSIRYFKQNNSGKYIAINKGIEEAYADWFFIVDSDDYLTNNAIERIIYYIRQIDTNNKFAGVVGLRKDSKGNEWNSWFGKKTVSSNWPQNNYIDTDAINFRYHYKILGDKAEVVRTKLLRNFMFPTITNEKFMVEGYLWLSIAKAGYIFRWFKEAIYVTEYLDTGLTKNINNYYLQSPINSSMFYNLQLSSATIPIYIKIKASAKYYYYGFIGKKHLFQLNREINNKLYMVIGLLGLVFFKIRDYRYSILGAKKIE